MQGLSHMAHAGGFLNLRACIQVSAGSGVSPPCMEVLLICAADELYNGDCNNFAEIASILAIATGMAGSSGRVKNS